jgi:peptide/nickel transport system substrate-binding protein
VLSVAEGKLIPAKTGAGESDLQARDIQFNNYTFLEEGREDQQLQDAALEDGARLAIRAVSELERQRPRLEAARARRALSRALSLAIDRAQVNQVLFFGLAAESNDTVVAESPLFKKEYQTRWTQYDKKAAEKLLDELGLKRGPDGVRKLPDGRPMEIIVETAGESTEQTDVLEMIREPGARSASSCSPSPRSAKCSATACLPVRR